MERHVAWWSQGRVGWRFMDGRCRVVEGDAATIIDADVSFPFDMTTAL